MKTVFFYCKSKYKSNFINFFIKVDDYWNMKWRFRWIGDELVVRGPSYSAGAPVRPYFNREAPNNIKNPNNNNNSNIRNNNYYYNKISVVKRRRGSREEVFGALFWKNRAALSWDDRKKCTFIIIICIKVRFLYSWRSFRINCIVSFRLWRVDNFEKWNSYNCQHEYVQSGIKNFIIVNTEKVLCTISTFKSYRFSHFQNVERNQFDCRIEINVSHNRYADAFKCKCEKSFQHFEYENRSNFSSVTPYKLPEKKSG